MTHRYAALLWVPFLIIVLVACQGEAGPAAAYDPADLQFSGENALATVAEFTGNFPYRDSPEINNELAADWLSTTLTEAGWACISDEWEVINYSRPLPLENVICHLPGESQEEIVVMANYDQGPTTIEGADSNGSGVAIMLQLAQIFAAEEQWPYTLVFAATDGQVYGMLGAQRLIQSHPDPERIVAAVSLNNLGLNEYDGLGMAAVGLVNGYGPLWLQKSAQQAAHIAGDVWIPQMQSEWYQTLAQMLPVAMTDQGPFVAEGVPAIGLFGLPAAEYEDQYWEFFHSPADTIEHQSATTLYQSGRVVEGLIRQLQGMEKFPASFAPYLAYEGGAKFVPPAVFYGIAFLLAGIFLLASILSATRPGHDYWKSISISLPHFLSLWLPFVASILLLYLFVAVGWLEEFDTYPATPKDPILTEPRWFVVVIWMIALWEFLQMGRHLGALYVEHRPRPAFTQVRALTFLIIGLAVLVVMIMNPLSVLALIPLIAWLLIGGRRGWGRLLDWALFLLGGLFFYLLLYFIGTVLLPLKVRVFWYLLMGLSVGTVDFFSASLGFAILASGLALLVSRPWRRRALAEETAAESMAEKDPMPVDAAETGESEVA